MSTFGIQILQFLKGNISSYITYKELNISPITKFHNFFEVTVHPLECL